VHTCACTVYLGPPRLGPVWHDSVFGGLLLRLSSPEVAGVPPAGGAINSNMGPEDQELRSNGEAYHISVGPCMIQEPTFSLNGFVAKDCCTSLEDWISNAAMWRDGATQAHMCTNAYIPVYIYICVCVSICIVRDALIGPSAA